MYSIETVAFLKSDEYGCEVFPGIDSIQALIESAAKQTLMDGIEREVGWIVKRVDSTD